MPPHESIRVRLGRLPDHPAPAQGRGPVFGSSPRDAPERFGLHRPFLPDSWALSWCKASRADRISQARRFAIAEEALDGVIATVTDLVSDETRYGLVRPNQHGFLPDLESARHAVAHISRPDSGAEPGLWLPWLLVEHSLDAF